MRKETSEYTVCVCSKLENTFDFQVEFAYVTCNLRPLAFTPITTFFFLNTYNSDLILLKAKHRRKSQDFNTNGFSKTKKSFEIIFS